MQRKARKKNWIKKVAYTVLVVGGTVIVAYYSKDLGVVIS